MSELWDPLCRTDGSNPKGPIRTLHSVPLHFREIPLYYRTLLYSLFTESIVQRNERVRASPSWFGNERTNQNIAFGPSPFPGKTIIPYHPIILTLYLPSKLQTSVASKSLSQKQ